MATFRYEVRDDLGDFGCCHCTSCRKASGSAFGGNAPVDRDRFTLLSGEASLREFESSPGKLRAFCSRCGSPLVLLAGAQLLDNGLDERNVWAFYDALDRRAGDPSPPS